MKTDIGDEELTVEVPLIAFVELDTLLAASSPLSKLPVAARPLGTWTNIAGSKAAAATP